MASTQSLQRRFIVKPGEGLGPFILGSKISAGFNLIRANSALFQRVEFKYNGVDPLSMSYVLDLKSIGIELRYDSRTQRLELIRVYDLSLIELSYAKPLEGRVFSAPNCIPTLQQIYDDFGPTFEGKHNKDETIYVLSYPGLAFSFPTSKNEDNQKMAQPFNARLNTIYIWRDERPDDLDLTVEATIGEGVTIIPPQRFDNLRDSDEPEPYTKSSFMMTVKNPATLDFSSSTQDVILVLGEPDSITYKAEDPLSIHKKERPITMDYFYNYFRFGIDILFDGTKHIVKKFILWTNLPAQPYFTKYEKCHYKIFPPLQQAGSVQLEEEPNDAIDVLNQGPVLIRQPDDADEDLLKDFSNPPQQPAIPQDDLSEDNAQHERRKVLDESSEAEEYHNSQISDAERPYITPDMKFSAIEEILGKPIGEPFLTPASQNSPFKGQHRYFAYKDVIFEVMDTNYVSKVILFKS